MTEDSTVSPLCRSLSIAAALALVPAATWFGLQAISQHSAPLMVERVIQVLWPSSIWLMATDGMESTPTGRLIVLMAITANVLLYCGVGAIIWATGRRSS
jgi:hypothetical protein